MILILIKQMIQYLYVVVYTDYLSLALGLLRTAYMLTKYFEGNRSVAPMASLSLLNQFT